MASDDEDELAAMRRARNAKLGIMEVTNPDETQLFEDEPARPFRPPPAMRALAVDSEDEEDGPVIVGGAEDPELTAVHELRGSFPMAFGQQEGAAARAEDLYAEARNARKSHAASGAASVQPPLGDAVGVDLLSQQAKHEDVAPDRQGGALPRVEDSEEDSDEESGDPYLMPVTHETSLQSHRKLVTAIALDPKGARLLTGSEDHQVQMYDFGGMKRDMRSFRSFEPSEGCPINAISFSPTGDMFMVVSGSSQPKIYDREGHELGEFVKGDMYIRDSTHTKGHQYRCCFGQWHPNEKETVATCSQDGTVRLWDSNAMKQKTVLKPTLRRAGRTAITTCTYNAEGSIIAGGLADGSIQLWDVRGKVGRSAAIGQVAVPKAQMVPKQDWSYVAGAKTNLQGCHEKDSDISSLCFSSAGTMLLSRAADDTLKVWDPRKLKTSLAEFSDLPAAPLSQCCFSPDEALIATGTAAIPESPSGGALAFFDTQRLELVRRVEIGPSVAAVVWHPKLNQIFIGTGDRKGGCARVLYNPSYSESGVLKAAARTPRAVSTFDFEAPLIIKNPHALPMYRDESQQGGGGRKRKAELDAKKAKKTKLPDLGLSRAGQVGKGGTIGVSNGALLTQHVLKQQGMMTVPEEEDVRALLLRHEGAQDSEVSRLFAAYATTQPTKIFSEEEPGPQDEKKS